MDVVSEILKSITLDGAVFYNAEFSAPWGFRSPASSAIVPYLSRDPGHVIIYHFVVEGKAWARTENGEPTDLGPGDIVIFPHGDPHLMGNGRPANPVDNSRELERILSQGLQVVRMGGGGEITKFVCGYMMCEPQLSQMLLAGLPRILKVNIRNDASGEWLENTICYLATRVGKEAAGTEAVLAKLSEVLFVEALRRYIERLPAGEAGWLAGARDPEVGRAMALMHRDPSRPWTIAGLAAEVGICRAVLAERFRHYLGEAPIAYLTRWRMQLGARVLTTTSQSIAEIAGQVGYDSEAAFNRAFKRQFGVPPARFRREAGKARANRAGT